MKKCRIQYMKQDFKNLLENYELLDDYNKRYEVEIQKLGKTEELAYTDSDISSSTNSDACDNKECASEDLVKKTTRKINAKIKTALALGITKQQYKKMETSYRQSECNKEWLKMNKTQRLRGKMILQSNRKQLQHQFESRVMTERILNSPMKTSINTPNVAPQPVQEATPRGDFKQ